MAKYNEVWFRTSLQCCQDCPKTAIKYLDKKKAKCEVDQFFLVVERGEIYVEGYFDPAEITKKLSRMLCQRVTISQVESSPYRTVNGPIPEEVKVTKAPKPRRMNRSMKSSEEEKENGDNANNNVTYYGDFGGGAGSSAGGYNYDGLTYNYGVERDGASHNYATDDAPITNFGLTVGRGSDSTSSYNSMASGGGYNNNASVGSNASYHYGNNGSYDYGSSSEGDYNFGHGHYNDGGNEGCIIM